METIVGDYVGATIGIHSPIPYKEPDNFGVSRVMHGCCSEVEVFVLVGLSSTSRVSTFTLGFLSVCVCGYPDPREDPKSRSLHRGS